MKHQHQYSQTSAPSSSPHRVGRTQSAGTVSGACTAALLCDGGDTVVDKVGDVGSAHGGVRVAWVQSSPLRRDRVASQSEAPVGGSPKRGREPSASPEHMLPSTGSPGRRQVASGHHDAQQYQHRPTASPNRRMPEHEATLCASGDCVHCGLSPTRAGARGSPGGQTSLSESVPGSSGTSDMHRVVHRPTFVARSSPSVRALALDGGVRSLFSSHPALVEQPRGAPVGSTVTSTLGADVLSSDLWGAGEGGTGPYGAGPSVGDLALGTSDSDPGYGASAGPPHIVSPEASSRLNPLSVFFNRYHISGRPSRATSNQGSVEPADGLRGGSGGGGAGDGGVEPAAPRLVEPAECRLSPTRHSPAGGTGLPRAAALALDSSALSVMHPGSIATALLVTMLWAGVVLVACLLTAAGLSRDGVGGTACGASPSHSTAWTVGIVGTAAVVVSSVCGMVAMLRASLLLTTLLSVLSAALDLVTVVHLFGACNDGGRLGTAAIVLQALPTLLGALAVAVRAPCVSCKGRRAVVTRVRRRQSLTHAFGRGAGAVGSAGVGPRCSVGDAVGRSFSNSLDVFKGFASGGDDGEVEAVFAHVHRAAAATAIQRAYRAYVGHLLAQRAKDYGIWANFKVQRHLAATGWVALGALMALAMFTLLLCVGLAAGLPSADTKEWLFACLSSLLCLMYVLEPLVALWTVCVINVLQLGRRGLRDVVLQASSGADL